MAVGVGGGDSEWSFASSVRSRRSRTGKTLELGGQKQRAVLAMLLLEPNRVVATSRLIDAGLEDAPPETAAKAIQVHSSQLRKTASRHAPPGTGFATPRESS